MSRKKGSTVYTKEELRQHKTIYMLQTPWLCIQCNRIYSLAGKSCHLKTQEHERNSREHEINPIQ